MRRAGEMSKIWVLRLFAASWGAIFAIAACLLAKSFPGSTIWVWPLGITAACAVGLFLPALLRRPYALVEQVLGPVGQLLSFITLGLVYFGVFTPFAALLRWRGWDPLRLKCTSRTPSAWIDRPGKPENSDYRWQY